MYISKEIIGAVVFFIGLLLFFGVWYMIVKGLGLVVLLLVLAAVVIFFAAPHLK